MDKLEQILGYCFKNKALLKQALTHSSITGNVAKNYERLEFVGDRVLGMAMAHLLFKTFDKDAEGLLSPRHTGLVRKETVAEVALKLRLNEYILAEPKEICHNENVLCDVAEAIIGAICMDSNFETAIEFVDRHWKYLINASQSPIKDNKTALQELAHRYKAANPVYEMVRKEGTEHEPYFFIKVVVDGLGEAVGSGKNKKLAEQNAALRMIKKLEGENAKK
ncbi:MAG: ribonuclease III [Alphaproteobacteria bacterium]|nr:ribonuclease III [Alphaproteobacteria bacterium]